MKKSVMDFVLERLAVEEAERLRKLLDLGAPSILIQNTGRRYHLFSQGECEGVREISDLADEDRDFMEWCTYDSYPVLQSGYFGRYFVFEEMPEGRLYINNFHFGEVDFHFVEAWEVALDNLYEVFGRTCEGDHEEFARTDNVTFGPYAVRAEIKSPENKKVNMPRPTTVR